MLITLVVIALVAYTGFRGGTWLLADNRFAMARDAVAPEGVLRRGAVGSSISGELTFRHVYYQPHELVQPFHAERVRYLTGSPVALITSLITPGQMPGRWQLRVEGLALALDKAMTRDWVMASQAGAGARFAPVCGQGERPYLGVGNMVEMGVAALEADALLNQTQETLQFELNTAIAGSLELDWPGARLDPTRPFAVAETTNEPVSVVIRDAGLMRMLSAYCARESGMSLDAWVKAVTDAFGKALAGQGYKPSPQLTALLARWFADGGSLQFSLQPKAPLFGLPVRDDDSVSEDAAEFDIRYNDARVPDVWLTTFENEPPPVEASVTGVAEGATGDRPDTLGWRSSQVAESPRWLDRQVRVTLSNGKTVTGRLATVRDGRMTIARSMEGGEVAYPVLLDAVREFEVWRRRADPGRPMPSPEADDARPPGASAARN
jgi:hypothetical protein